MNGSRLIAGCFRFIFGSRYAESTRTKFGVTAYSRINTVSIKNWTVTLCFVTSLFRQNCLWPRLTKHASPMPYLLCASVLEQFSIACRRWSGIALIYLTLLCKWFEKTCAIPRTNQIQFASFYFEFSLAYDYVNLCSDWSLQLLWLWFLNSQLSIALISFDFPFLPINDIFVTQTCTLNGKDQIWKSMSCLIRRNGGTVTKTKMVC